MAGKGRDHGGLVVKRLLNWIKRLLNRKVEESNEHKGNISYQQYAKHMAKYGCRVKEEDENDRWEE